MAKLIEFATQDEASVAQVSMNLDFGYPKTLTKVNGGAPDNSLTEQTNYADIFETGGVFKLAVVSGEDYQAGYPDETIVDADDPIFNETPDVGIDVDVVSYTTEYLGYEGNYLSYGGDL